MKVACARSFLAARARKKASALPKNRWRNKTANAAEDDVKNGDVKNNDAKNNVNKGINKGANKYTSKYTNKYAGRA